MKKKRLERVKIHASCKLFCLCTEKKESTNRCSLHKCKKKGKSFLNNDNSKQRREKILEKKRQ
jgi:hypothetical protein